MSVTCPRLSVVLAAAGLLLAGCPAQDESADAGADGDVGDGGGEGGLTDGGDGGDAAEPINACLSGDALSQALRQRLLKIQRRERALAEREHAVRLLGEAIDERLGGLGKARELASREIEQLEDQREGHCREQVAKVREEKRQEIEGLRQEYADLEKALTRWEQQRSEESDTQREQDLTRLAASIRSMRSDAAAAAVSALDTDTATLLLARLPERNVGKILGSMPPDQAAAIVRATIASSKAPTRQALRSEDGEGEEEPDNNEASP